MNHFLGDVFNRRVPSRKEKYPLCTPLLSEVAKKKKMQLCDYCNLKFDYIFSDQFEVYADELKSDVGDAFHKQIDQNKYLDHLRGVFLTLLGIAFSITLKHDQRYDVLEKEYFKKHNSEELVSLHQRYHSKFESCQVDGVKQMATYFSNQFLVNNIDLSIVVNVYYNGFHQMVNNIFDELKKIELV